MERSKSMMRHVFIATRAIVAALLLARNDDWMGLRPKELDGALRVAEYLLTGYVKEEIKWDT